MPEPLIAFDQVLAECAMCDELVTTPGRVAVIMVKPDGSVHGVVCGECVWSGRFTRILNRAIAHDRQGDTPTDDVASPEERGDRR